MKRNIELLAPGGDLNSIKAAIIAGADAVYCGLEKFNARKRAVNISFENLQGILRLAHANNCKVFLTFNILITDNELPEVIAILNKLKNTSIDGIIIQDLGIFYVLNRYFESIDIHASTQMTTHNSGQILFLKRLKASRVNLSRELNLGEIKDLTSMATSHGVATEVFVHGSYCISFSGICYMSSVHSGKSANRGCCSQPCRDRYKTTSVEKNYPLNLKDNSAYFDLKELYDAGVSSLKIEGRIKEFDYVYRVVKTWKEQIQSFLSEDRLLSNKEELYKVFNRDFSNAFLKGNINKEMFIDNPSSQSGKHFSDANEFAGEAELTQGQIALYEEKDILHANILSTIAPLGVEKPAISIGISGSVGEALEVRLTIGDTSISAQSDIKLSDHGSEALSQKMIIKRFKALNETAYEVKQIDYDIKGAVFLPFKELTSLKKKLLFILNDSREWQDLVVPHPLKRPVKNNKTTPGLSILIASRNDLSVCKKTTSNVFFQLPNAIYNEYTDLADLFLKNKDIIPWFPSILIGKDFESAVALLQHAEMKYIVTDNSGIAYEAFKMGIEWVAGPQLNITNSYALLSLKEHFNCHAAFISNELSRTQIKAIKKPDNFELYYSIFHPITLMTSRQCLFHQVSGCEKHIIDNSCIEQCEKSATIVNVKNQSMNIEKIKGNYHQIYHDIHFLNTEIAKDLPELFSYFTIDLRDIHTETAVECDKTTIISLFEKHILGHSKSSERLHNCLSPTTNNQYKKGI